MTTVVDFEVSAADTVMGGVFETVPSAACQMEQVIASNGHGLWLTGAKRVTLEAALEADPSVAAYTLISEIEDRWLYDVAFAPAALDVFDEVVTANGTVLSAAAADGWWTLQIRFVDRDDASALYDRLVERDTDATLVRLANLNEQGPTDYGLTPKQYEALLAALDHGYFTIPRETSMEELATELGVSHQALSERLRRAYRALVVTELNGTAAPDVSPSPDQPISQ